MFFHKNRRFSIIVFAAAVLLEATNLSALVTLAGTCRCCREQFARPRFSDGNCRISSSKTRSVSKGACKGNSGYQFGNQCCQSQAKCKCTALCKCTSFCKCNLPNFPPLICDVLWRSKYSIEFDFLLRAYENYRLSLTTVTGRKYLLPIANRIRSSFVPDYCTWLCRFLI